MSAVSSRTKRPTKPRQDKMAQLRAVEEQARLEYDAQRRREMEARKAYDERLAKEYSEYRQRLAERNAQISKIRALFALGIEDAATIFGDYDRHPDNRYAPDLVQHVALLLRARRRFMSGSGRRVGAGVAA